MDTWRTLLALLLIQTIVCNASDQDTEIFSIANIRQDSGSHIESAPKNTTKAPNLDDLTTFVPVTKWSPGAGNRSYVYPKPGKPFIAGVGKGDAYTDQELRTVAQVLEQYLTICRLLF